MFGCSSRVRELSSEADERGRLRELSTATTVKSSNKLKSAVTTMDLESVVTAQSTKVEAAVAAVKTALSSGNVPAGFPAKPSGAPASITDVLNSVSVGLTAETLNA